MRRPTRNEYGTKLDKNGYAASLFALEPHTCFHCHKVGDVARHELFFGPLRSKSKQYGLWITVCPACHALIHDSGELQDYYHKLGQAMAMVYYKWNVADFRQRFYKNYSNFSEDE